MNREQIVEYIKTQIDEFTDSRGDLCVIYLIEHVQEKFGVSPRDAESMVYEALGYGDE